MDNSKIERVISREVLDSRGNPTVEAEVILTDTKRGRGIAPSGASTGKYEALELRDKDSGRYFGNGTQKAVENVRTQIAEALVGKDAYNLCEIDQIMLKKDGTKDKSALGANAILAVSIANANAAAHSMKKPLYEVINQAAQTDEKPCKLPVPMMNILNGGRHAQNTVDFQEFMIMPVGAETFCEALRMGTEVYHALKKLLVQNQKSTAVGDEGGFAPDLKDVFEVFDYLTKAVEAAGYRCGKDIVFAMDAAASELYDEASQKYYFKGESTNEKVMRSADEMIALYEEICNRYPLYSIEDGLHEEDWDGFAELTRRLGSKVQLVGDDLFVTNTKRLQRGIKEGCGNSILIKLNQIGTISETIEAIKMAQKAGYTAVVSHRSGETEDTTIADLAVALNCGQIKTGAPCRTERVAKYNRLLRIEEELGEDAIYPGRKVFENL